jgi:hypothetical protein
MAFLGGWDLDSLWDEIKRVIQNMHNNGIAKGLTLILMERNLIERKIKWFWGHGLHDCQSIWLLHSESLVPSARFSGTKEHDWRSIWRLWPFWWISSTRNSTPLKTSREKKSATVVLIAFEGLKAIIDLALQVDHIKIKDFTGDASVYWTHTTEGGQWGLPNDPPRNFDFFEGGNIKKYLWSRLGGLIFSVLLLID